MKKLFYGGPVLTMTDEMCVEALAEENGKILAAGTKEELEKRYPDSEKQDLKGHTLMPAFIDPHSHYFQVAASLLQVSLNGADNTEEMKRRIGDFIEKHQLKKGEWVIARDYDQNIMPGFKHPGMEDLNAFAPGHPLVIHHKSGHMGLMNDMAFKELGIHPDTPVPEGGKIEQENGKLTGYLEENAFFEAIKKVPMAGPAQLLNAFMDAQDKYASYGITTLQDGMVVKEMLPMYKVLNEKNMVHLDVVLYAGLDAYEEAKKTVENGNGHLSVGGLKIFLDGSPQGRTAWMREAYADDASYKGYPTMTDEMVEKAFEEAAVKHTQLIAHCNGDAAAEQFLRCLEKAEEKYPELKELHPVIIHGQLMGKDQLPSAKKLGAMISFFVAHVYHWGDVHLRNFGEDRAKKISAAGSAMKENINVTFHQDAPVIEPDMLETIWCAVNRISKNGVQFDENEKVSVWDALKAVTINGAKQYGEEKIKGTLEEGKLADLVILNQNPLEVPPMEIKNIRVLQTFKEGKCVYTAK